MAKTSRPKRPYYHLEMGAPEVEGFFIFLLGAINRIELVSVAFEYVIFRVVYPERSYLFGFRRGYPFIYPDRTQRKIRLSTEAYHALYRIADVLMIAVFCGVQANYHHKKGSLRTDTGDLFRLSSLLPSQCVVGVNGVEYAFVHSEGEYFFRGSDETIPPALRRFLYGFLPLVMRTYRPYRRKLGERLDELSLYPDLEQEPPRKVRQMRHQNDIERLRAQGKPPKLKPSKELEQEVIPNLFEPRTLRR
jgi:hypothetical protein